MKELDKKNKYDLPTWLIEALKAYDGMMFSPQTKVEKMKAKRDLHKVILSEARRIGMEAIGEDREYDKYGQCPSGCGMQYGCSCDSAEFRVKTAQLQKLMEMTKE